MVPPIQVLGNPSLSIFIPLRPSDRLRQELARRDQVPAADLA
jgi:hypothetical protein